MKFVETIHLLCRPCTFDINLEIIEDKLEHVIVYVTQFDTRSILSDITHSSKRFSKRAPIRIWGYFPSAHQHYYPKVIEFLLQNSLVSLWSVALTHGINVINFISYSLFLQKQSWVTVQLNQAVILGGIFCTSFLSFSKIKINFCWYFHHIMVINL
jgi:hypothetical protein